MYRSIKTTLIIFNVIVLTASLLFAYPTFAAGNKLYLSPTENQLSIGGTVTVNVRGYIETSSNVGSVSGSVTYPSAQLRAIGTSTTGSAYTNPNISVGANAITFSGTKNPGPTGQVHIFTITFQAVGAGNARLDFAPNSTLNQAATGQTGATYIVAAPSTPTPTTPTPTPTPTTPTPTPTPTTPTPTPTPTTPTPTADEQDVTTPDTSGLVTNVNRYGEYNKATVSWGLSDAKATTELMYGNTVDTITTKAEVSRSNDGIFSATLSNLSPGTRYFFHITATQGELSGVYSGTIATLGYPVVVKITQDGQPVVNAKIQIGPQQYATNKDGFSTLSLAANTYTLGITSADTSQQESITVEKKAIPGDGSAPEKQTYTFNLPAVAIEQSTNSGVSVLIFIGILVAGVALLTIAFLVFVTLKRKRLETGAGYTNTTPTTSVIIEDGYDWDKEHQPEAGATFPSDDALSNGPIMPRNTSVNISDEEPKDMFELAQERTHATPFNQDSSNTSARSSDQLRSPNQ